MVSNNHTLILVEPCDSLEYSKYCQSYNLFWYLNMLEDIIHDYKHKLLVMAFPHTAIFIDQPLAFHLPYSLWGKRVWNTVFCNVKYFFKALNLLDVFLFKALIHYVLISHLQRNDLRPLIEFKIQTTRIIFYLRDKKPFQSFIQKKIYPNIVHYGPMFMYESE